MLNEWWTVGWMNLWKGHFAWRKEHVSVFRKHAQLQVQGRGSGPNHSPRNGCFIQTNTGGRPLAGWDTSVPAATIPQPTSPPEHGEMLFLSSPAAPGPAPQSHNSPLKEGSSKAMPYTQRDPAREQGWYLSAHLEQMQADSGLRRGLSSVKLC